MGDTSPISEYCRGGGMADTAVSKTVETNNLMRVRLPLPAPIWNF